MHSTEWRCTTQHAAWRALQSPSERRRLTGFRDFDVLIQSDSPRQVIRGFGATFNELGWLALQALPSSDREALLHLLFAPGSGLNLRICRLPIGASDYARGWYSHNETEGDFAMAHFDAARDDESLVPYIHAAQRHQPGLELWASPWSPPTWMKRNRHYAMVAGPTYLPDNGLRPDQAGKQGEDSFILEERYLRAYALYFRRFVEAYRDRSIPISMIMPQNEFNSAQFFPSCYWTPQGLAQLLAYLGPEMQSLDVAVYLGTLERALPGQIDSVMAYPEAARYVTGVGLQWAARQAASTIAHAHPSLELMQSEQECGDGRNDWRFARYAWKMMRDFFAAGVSVYCYWNIATPVGGMSTWGWKQNSLISVDLQGGSHALNADFHVLRHLSHFVQPGAHRLDTLSITGHENLLAFRNPDGRTVLAVQNDLADSLPLRVALDGEVIDLVLPADSLNTLLL